MMPLDLRLSDPTRLGLTSEAVERWCRWFLVLGLVVRCVRYFLCFPLWEDECFLCYNYLDRDYLGLTEKLDFPPQLAPIFYLWSQLSIVRFLGFNEWTLRLTAFLAGLASLVLFNRLARIFLTGAPRLFAVAIFSVSYVGVRYGAEAKPYGIDLFVSLAMTTLFLRWLQTGRGRDLLACLISLPILMGFSFPAVFVGGGLTIFGAAAIGRRASRTAWLGLFSYAVILTATFAGFFLLNIQRKMDTDLGSMQGYWNHSFPPIDRPWLLPLFLLRAHASELTAYPAGGPSYSSIASFLVWVAAMVGLVRVRARLFLVFALAPLGLTFAAAAMGKYPYGGHFKFNLYLAPATCLTLGYGLALIADWATRRFPARRVVHATLALLAGCAVVTAARDIATPYKSLGDHHYRAFARWFWPQMEHSAEVVCCKRDLNLDVSPQTYDRLNYAAVYLCNQAIASPRRRNGGPIVWDAISDARPLVCVLYRDPWEPFDEAELTRWLDAMTARYRLVNRSTLPMHRKDHTNRHIVCNAYLDLFRFLPHPPTADAQAPNRAK